MTDGLADVHRPDTSAPAPCPTMICNGERMKELVAKASRAAVGDVKVLGLSGFPNAILGPFGVFRE